MLTRRTVLSSALSTLAACSLPGAPVSAASPATLRPYRDEAQLRQALERWRSEASRLQAARQRSAVSALGAAESATMSAPAPAAPAAMAEKSADAAAPAESITNVQTAGVDEGGIVKRAGDFLVILRRGRLFTVRVGGDTLRPTAMCDAYAPNADPAGAWYDELLISGRTVVVVGYSYARGGTEIGLFELGADGDLAYRATYHLRSFDYYSARNYASRLIGRRLVFYSPTILSPWGESPWQMMPAMRRWQGVGTPADFERILPATRIYRTDDDFDPRETLALHTVTVCDLDGPQMRCESTAVLGPAGRVFYVSQGSVYVWTAPWRRRFAGEGERPAQPPLSAVFRVPLDGAAPTALKAAGVPVDQLSFLEDGGGHLNVLLREFGAGEGMWGHAGAGGALALLRVPLSAFGDGRGSAQPEHYRPLPEAARDAAQNRFVGDWLLWGGNGRESAWALRYADADEPVRLDPGHRVERIEAMGNDAVLVGNAGADLHFSSVRLGRGDAAVAGKHVQRGARQGETRTHGFFFRPSGGDEGLLGLPVLGNDSASVLFLRERGLDFTPLGRLKAEVSNRRRDDRCKASCVDWYGNARPIFLGERIFALMGYELVEGTLEGGRGAERIEERRRIGFAPSVGVREGRYSPFN